MMTKLTIGLRPHGMSARTHVSLVAGMPGASSSIYCSVATPAIFTIGGMLQQEQRDDLNSLAANFNGRQLQT